MDTRCRGRSNLTLHPYSGVFQQGTCVRWSSATHGSPDPSPLRKQGPIIKKTMDTRCRGHYSARALFYQPVGSLTACCGRSADAPALQQDIGIPPPPVFNLRSGIALILLSGW